MAIPKTFTFSLLSTIGSSVCIMCFCALVPMIVAAQEFVPLADVDGSKLAGLYSGSGDESLAVFLGRIFSFAITIGAMLAILRLAYAGYLYMVSDLWVSKERAKETFQDTILGLLLLLAVYLILHQINPDILDLNILNTLQTNPAQNYNPGTGSSSAF